MNKIDTIAIMLFLLWIFGFIHIVLAIIVVAFLVVIYQRQKKFHGPKGESRIQKMFRSHDK